MSELEVAARALRAAFLRTNGGVRETQDWEDLPPLVRERYRSEAAAVLKAVREWHQANVKRHVV